MATTILQQNAGFHDDSGDEVMVIDESPGRRGRCVTTLSNRLAAFQVVSPQRRRSFSSSSSSVRQFSDRDWQPHVENDDADLRWSPPPGSRVDDATSLADSQDDDVEEGEEGDKMPDLEPGSFFNDSDDASDDSSGSNNRQGETIDELMQRGMPNYDSWSLADLKVGDWCMTCTWHPANTDQFTAYRVTIWVSQRSSKVCPCQAAATMLGHA